MIFIDISFLNKLKTYTDVCIDFIVNNDTIFIGQLHLNLTMGVTG